MKIKTFLAAVAVAAGVAAPGLSSGAVYRFQGGSDVDAGITFLGDPARTISFPNLGTFDFVITNSADGTTTGLKGNISGSPAFDVGLITTIGGLQLAPASGSGSISVFDGSTTLTANLTFDEVTTFGTSIGLSFSTLVNVSNVIYSGSTPAFSKC